MTLLRMKVDVVACLLAVSVGAFAACPNIVSREEWGARPPISISTQPLPIPYVVIHHSETETCTDFSTCSALVRGLQVEHMDVNRWTDIGFNFLIGEDGNVYEGRGWEAIGAHTPGLNSMSVGIAFIGVFSDFLPNEEALLNAKLLFECGKEGGYLFSNFRLVGHSQAGTTECPGAALYQEISTWPEYEPNPLN